MDFIHKPVLYEEVLNSLKINPDGVYVDGTTGGGGHSSGIIKKLGVNGTLICIDQDKEAIEAAKARIEKSNVNGASVIFENTNFSNIKEACRNNGFNGVDGILMDIGVSSYQLDNPERGFSYNHDAPLDMRMNSEGALTAYEIVNTWSKNELKKIIEDYGEERWADRIAQFITDRRKVDVIRTTYDLVDIIKAAVPKGARRDGPHPAKRTFQAIRIAVNDELGVLDRAITEGIDLLNVSGRFSIITFHSLEDRIVKMGFNEEADPCKCPKSFPVCICNRKARIRIISRKPIVPKDEEIEENHRARSSKMRVVERI